MIEKGEKKQRIDKEINIAKVTNALLHNPLATEREIAEIAWVSNWTAHNTIKEIEQNWAKSEKIEAIATKDISIIELWLNEIERRLSDAEELKAMRTVEISQVIKENTARYTLFKGKATDENGWYNGSDLLLDIQNGLITREEAYDTMKKLKQNIEK